MPPWTSSKSKQNLVQISATQSANKNHILKAITDGVSEVQYQYRNSGETLPSNDITTRLCTALEAVFIHGLKETFLGRLSSRFSDGGVASPRMPEPSFWTFALVFSHKEVIGQIESLKQINTDVGRSRTWLRLALNDGLLLSYLSAMIADKVSLAVHYEKFAFLRDTEKRDLCLSYLNGVSVFTFSLSTNVSTLNKWQTRPLVLAGCWRDSNVEIDIGADVAADIVENAETEQAPEFVRTLAEPIRDTAGMGYIRRGLLNEDEALRLILQSTPMAFSPQTQTVLGFDPNSIAEEEEDKTDNDTTDTLIEQKEDTSLQELATLENCQETPPRSPSPEVMMSRSETVSPIISPTLEWDNPSLEKEIVSSPCLAEEMRELVSPEPEVVEEDADSEEKVVSPVPSSSKSPPPRSGCQSPMSDCSSLSICQCPPDSPSEDCRICGTKSPPRLNLVLQETFHSDSGGAGDLIREQNSRERRLAGMGFSETPGIRVASLTLSQNIRLTRCLDLICHEEGLDNQDWRCQDCGKSIGALFGVPRLCQFTRRYYCDECHNNTDTSVIPARLLYNWDAKQYKVAKSSLLFLKSINTKPMINANTFSPNLSKIAPVLDCSHRLRKQLTYLEAYLTACAKANQEGVKVALAEIVWPREYLYTDTEMYSIQDLEQLHSGLLISTLTSAVKLCTNHVNSCLICSGRGFICEICKDKKPVYPFNLDTTSQCKDCHTVFHSYCAKDLLNCPRCERIEARNLQWHVTNSKLAREIGNQEM